MGWLHRECDRRLADQERVVLRLLRRIDVLNGTLRQMTADLGDERAHADRLRAALVVARDAVADLDPGCGFPPGVRDLVSDAVAFHDRRREGDE